MSDAKSGRERKQHLELTIERIWKRLEDAGEDAKHTWRMGAMATAEPGVRMMVLRGANGEARRLTFFTDIRSHKVESLRRQPRGEVLFWSPRIREQLRLKVAVEVHSEGDVVDAAWDAVSERNWHEYSTVAPPGQEIDSTKIGAAQKLTRAGARQNFVVLQCTVDEIEWMRLGPAAEHMRVRFTPTDTGWRGAYLG